METETFIVINYTILAIVFKFFYIFFSFFHTRKKLKSVLFHWNVIKEISNMYIQNK